jgi:hypothetical protein
MKDTEKILKFLDGIYQMEEDDDDVRAYFEAIQYDVSSFEARLSDTVRRAKAHCLMAQRVAEARQEHTAAHSKYKALLDRLGGRSLEALQQILEQLGIQGVSPALYSKQADGQDDPLDVLEERILAELMKQQDDGNPE